MKILTQHESAWRYPAPHSARLKSRCPASTRRRVARRLHFGHPERDQFIEVERELEEEAAGSGA